MPTLFTTIRSRISYFFSKAKLGFQRIVGRFPFISFLVLLALLVGLAFLGNHLRKPAPEVAEADPVVKDVEVYTLNSSPQIQVQAQVEKSGIIKLMALSGGVIQKIKTDEGAHVKDGQVLFALSTNYQGASIPSVSRKISQRNYQFVIDTYGLQKEAIAKNRELANKGETQQAELRAIARQSLDDTRALISLNEEINRGLDEQIKDLEESNVDGSNDAAIIQIKSGKAQVLGALSGLRTGLRNTEYLNDENQESAEMARLSRDAALKQLEIQEKSLDLNKSMAYLNLKIAQISESLMNPTAPCGGIVERIHVKQNQVVQPGTLLATIRSDYNNASAVALVSSEVAGSVSRLAASTAIVDGEKIALQTQYIAQEPTDGVLHAITFTVPEEIAPRLTNGSFLQVELPVGAGLYGSGNVYVPLDAVYQSQSSSSVFVTVQDGDKLKAESREVKLGQVYGRFVEVLEGLTAGDQVVINRNVIEDDLVKVTQ